MGKIRQRLTMKLVGAKEAGKWNYKDKIIINNGHWSHEKQCVISTLPKKIPSNEEIYERLVEAGAKITALTSPVVKKSRPKTKVKPKNEEEDLSLMISSDVTKNFIDTLKSTEKSVAE